MYTRENDPMIIPFDPASYDNRASALMAVLLAFFGLLLMFVSLWAFLPTSPGVHPQYSPDAPLHRSWEMVPFAINNSNLD